MLLKNSCSIIKISLTPYKIPTKKLEMLWSIWNNSKIERKMYLLPLIPWLPLKKLKGYRMDLVINPNKSIRICWVISRWRAKFITCINLSIEFKDKSSIWKNSTRIFLTKKWIEITLTISQKYRKYLKWSDRTIKNQVNLILSNK